MARRKIIRYAAVLAACGLACAGCGPQEQVHPVRGKVVYPDGEPMIAGQIEFESQDHDERINARGPIHSDGTFVLRTFKADDGALLGKHKVVVMAPFRDLSRPDLLGRGVHSQYTSYQESDIEFTVEPGENVFEITVEPKEGY